MAIQKPFAVIPHPLGEMVAGNALPARSPAHLGEFENPGLIWQTDGNTNVWVRGDFGEDRVVNFCAMLSANALPGTEIRLRLGDTQAEVDGTAPYDSTALDFISPSITRTDGRYGSHLDTGSDITARWWRIDITGHTGDFQAMALVLGKKATFSNYYNDKGFEFGQVDTGTLELGRFGVATKESGLKYRTLGMDMGWMTDSDRANVFQPLRDQIGVTGMALWCFDPDATVQRQDKTYFGFLRKSVAFRASSNRQDRWQSSWDILSII